MRLLFAVATSQVRKEMFESNLRNLLEQIKESGIESRVIVLSHKTDYFDSINIDVIEKLYKGKMLEGSLSDNRILDAMRGEDYVCWVHDDMRVLDDGWIKKAIEFYEKYDCGQVGLEWHTDSFLGRVPMADEVTWSDGVFLVSKEVISKVGRFDEFFVHDCDFEDYAYRIRKEGYKNYRLNLPFRHSQVRMSLKNPNYPEYIDRAREEYAIFKEKCKKGE
jgi:hypothetical protein